MSRVELRGITWNHVRGIGGLRAAADEFARSNPDVRVEWTTRSLQAFADEPVDELALRFDLLYIDHPAIGYAVARECLLPLDEHLEPAALEDQRASGVGRSAESYEWRGRRWALATDAAAQIAAYRPDLLERAGIAVPGTWDEALAAARALRRAGLWAALPSIPVDAICAFLAVCRGLGDEPFADEGAGIVSRDVGVAALDLLAAFVAECHPSSTAWNPPSMLEHMSSEDDVAYCPLAFGYSNYSRPGFRRRVVRSAASPSARAQASGTLGGAGLAISAHTRAPHEAAAFATFVADGATQRGVYFDGGGQPGHRSAWTDDRVNAGSSAFFRDTLAAVDTAYLRPRYDGFVRFQEAAGALVHAYLREPSDAADRLAALDDAYRASMASRGV